MHVIPVIDIKDGQAVHAVGGLREFYRPVQSAITDSSDPVRILTVMKRRFGIERCYIADIDALEGGPVNVDLLIKLRQVGASILVDVGVRTTDDVGRLLELQLDHIILGSETVEDIDLLRQIIDTYGSERFIFSIDLKAGHLVTRNSSWRDVSPTQLGLMVAETGIDQFILLDLSAVGTGRGLSTLDSCRELRRQLPDAQITAGGGVRTTTHLMQLEEAGANSALVATAIHSGSMTAQDLRQFRDSSASSRNAG